MLANTNFRQFATNSCSRRPNLINGTGLNDNSFFITYAARPKVISGG
ncbi:hypothetical protein PMAG_a2182 [Pseudoalteromonas mariniglutinosa NCIMB 1770]|nr:hypothetical protein [Pseudoalteromonas mariniglutinosa NCIMB 1770]